jgi:hypothetical protein
LEIVAPVISGLAAGVAFLILFSTFTNFLPLQRDSNTTVITLERTTCYGTCPEYSLTILGNGTVIYEGRNYVAVVGEHVYQIPSDNVKRLVDAFQNARFFSMQDGYDLCVDCATHTASMTIDGRTKTVVYSLYSAPASLLHLDKRIDEYADSVRWVECPDGERVATIESGGCLPRIT